MIALLRELVEKGGKNATGLKELGEKLDKIHYALTPPNPTDKAFKGEEGGIER